jgi:hypothetical protein
MANVDSKENSVVAVYPQHSDAENAINLLKKSDFNVKKLAIIGQGYHTEDQVVGYYTTGDRMKHWGKKGAFWGGLWGLLVLGFVISGSVPGSARDKNETIDATAFGTGTQLGANIGVTLNIYEFSTPADRQILVQVYEKGQNQGRHESAVEHGSRSGGYRLPDPGLQDPRSARHRTRSDGHG